jgi:hypothetical protein
MEDHRRPHYLDRLSAKSIQTVLIFLLASLQVFFDVVDVMFCWVFGELWCANVVFLHGRCGADVVICVAGGASKYPTKNGTAF